MLIITNAPFWGQFLEVAFCLDAVDYRVIFFVGGQVVAVGSFDTEFLVVGGVHADIDFLLTRLEEFQHFVLGDADGGHVQSIIVAQFLGTAMKPVSPHVLTLKQPSEGWVEQHGYLWVYIVGTLCIAFHHLFRRGFYIIKIVVPHLFAATHRGEAFPHVVDKLEVAQVLPGVDVVGEDVFGGLVVGYEILDIGCTDYRFQLVFGQQFKFLHRTGEQPSGCRVRLVHLGVQAVELLSESLDVAHYHQGSQSAVFGALSFLYELCCAKSEYQRNGGAEHQHSDLFPESATLGCHVHLRRVDDV